MAIFADNAPTRPEPKTKFIVSFGYIDDEKFIVVGFMDLHEKPSFHKCRIWYNMNDQDLAMLNNIANQLTRTNCEHSIKFHGMTVKIRAIFPPILSDEQKEILEFRR